MVGTANIAEYKKYVKKSHFGFLLLLTLSSVSFFKPIFLENTNVEIYIYTVLLMICLPAALKGLSVKGQFVFASAVKLLLISIVITIFIANVFWNQDMISSISATISQVIGYIVFFYLVKKKITAETIEKVIVIVGVLFVIVFSTSFLIYPDKFVEFYDLGGGRGFQRIFVAGDGFLFLLFFLSINRYVSYKKSSWLLLSIVTYVCIILTLTRVYILGASMLAIIFFILSKRTYIKVLVVTIVAVMFLVIPNLTFVKNLQVETNEQTSNIQDYIRFRAADYFTSDFQPSIITSVLGNGFAYGEKTSYGREILKLRSEGYFIEDLGLLGLYIHLGVLAIIAYIMIYYKGLRTKLQDDFIYLKLFIGFMIFLSVTTSITFNSSFIFPIVFTLYLYDKAKVTKDEELTS